MLIESAVRVVRLVDVEKKEFLSVRHLEAEVVIDGPLCRSDLRITFANDLDRTIEGDLVFPLPPFSALCELSVKVGKRVIEGKVRPRERAQAEYRRAVQAGKTAALGESEGEDLGRLRIAPIEIGEDVEVTIGLLHTLTPISDGHRLLLPLTYMPRYVEDEAGLKPTERAAVERPRPLTAAARANVKVTIRKNGVPVKVRCPTHSAQVDDRNGLLEVGVRGVALDRDLHLEICDRKTGEEPTVWVRHDPSQGPDKQGPTTAVALLPPPFADEGATIARSVILLVDRSGSMSGAPMESAIRAVKGCLRALGPADQFNVVAFSDSLYALSPRALQFSDVSLKLADEHASSLSATGGTEAGAALEAVLDDKISSKQSSVEFYSKEAPSKEKSKEKDDRHRLRIVVMMTDGDVGSAENVLRRAKDRLIDTRLFVIGIGESVNHAMLAQLAELGSGTYTPVSTNEDLERALHKLKNAIDAPLLTGVKVQLEAGGDRTLPQRLEPSGRLDLFAGQPLLLAFRGDVPRGAVLHVSAQSTDGEDVTFSVPIPIAESASAVDAETASVLWALLRNRRLTYRFDAADDATLEALGVAFGLVNRKVAIVGVHDEQRDTDAPESVPVVLPMPRNLGPGAPPPSTGGPPPPAPSRPMPMRASASAAAPPPPMPSPIVAAAPEVELEEAEGSFDMMADESSAPVEMLRAPSAPASPSKKRMAAKPSAPKLAKEKGGILGRVKNLFGGGGSDRAQAADEDDAEDRKESSFAPPPAPPPPLAQPPMPVQAAPMPSSAAAGLARATPPREQAKQEASYHFTDDEAGLRALLLSQRADGMFGAEGDLGATVAAIAALVGRGHTARTGSFRAELRRTVQALRSLLPSTSGDDKTLCALGLALLLMPNGEAAPAELPAEIAQILDGKSASDGAALAPAVRAAVGRAPAAIKASALAAEIFRAFLK